MAELAGCRVLIAGDEYFLASDTARMLRAEGAAIVGPVGHLVQVEKLIDQDGFDVALLDIQLDHALIYSAADRVRATGVPLVFLTGYDESSVPKRFADVPLCQKPCADETLIGMIKDACASG